MTRPFAAPLDLTDVNDSFRSRFWSKVDIQGPDDCWPWTAYRLGTGYGVFNVWKHRPFTASRVSLAISIGRPLALGEVACHACDNPPCVNPRHLFAGTMSVNNLDSQAKGRAHRAVGEATPSNKLTAAEVLEIRGTPARFGSSAELARRFGVSSTTIRRIRSGTKWRYLNDGRAA